MNKDRLAFLAVIFFLCLQGASAAEKLYFRVYLFHAQSPGTRAASRSTRSYRLPLIRSWPRSGRKLAALTPNSRQASSIP